MSFIDILPADEALSAPSIEELDPEAEASESNFAEDVLLHSEKKALSLLVRDQSEKSLEEQADGLATFLCNALEITIAKQPMEYQYPECVEQLRAAAQRLEVAKEDMFLKFSKHIGSCYCLFKPFHDELVEKRRRQQTQQDEAWGRLSKALHDIEAQLGAGGLKILSEFRRMMTEAQLTVNNATYAIDSKRRKDFTLKEDIRHKEGLLIAVNPDIVPKVSKRLDPTGISRSMMKTAWNVFHYTSVTRKENKVKVIEMQDKMHAEYRAAILKTNDEIRECRLAVSTATDIWNAICSAWERCSRAISTMFKNRDAIAIEEELPRYLYQMMKTFVVLKAPLTDLMNPMSESPAYERNIFVNRRVETFCKNVTSLAYLLTQLHTAKEILHDQFREGFTRDIYSLSDVISSYLGEFRKLYDGYKSAPDPMQQATFLTEESWKFAQDTGCCIQRILTTLKTRISSRKSKQADEHRDIDDRSQSGWHWPGRPLVQFKEALRVLRGLECAIAATYELSVAPGAEMTRALANAEGMKEPVNNATTLLVGGNFMSLGSLDMTLDGALQNLRSAKDIIRRRDRKAFEEDISTLSNCVWERICSIKTFHGQGCPCVDDECRTKFVKEKTWNFARRTGPLLRNLRFMMKSLTDERSKIMEDVSTEVSEAPNKDGVRSWKKLVTASAALQQVEDITKALHGLSITISIGKNLPKFCQSDSPQQFYEALDDEISALQRFRKGEPQTQRTIVNGGCFKLLRQYPR